MFMGTRITIMLDKDLEIKLRKIQAEQIKGTHEHVSFSNVVNEMLRKGL